MSRLSQILVNGICPLFVAFAMNTFPSLSLTSFEILDCAVVKMTKIAAKAREEKAMYAAFMVFLMMILCVTVLNYSPRTDICTSHLSWL